MTIPDEFDIIVCGGGSTGCVIAGRYVYNVSDIYSRQLDTERLADLQTSTTIYKFSLLKLERVISIIHGYFDLESVRLMLYNLYCIQLIAVDPRNMKLDSKTASFYYSRPSEWLAGRKAVVPCAHILGGGSSINFMMYTRASASDYDDFQAKGWTTKELIPLMRKHETYQRACNNRLVRMSLVNSNL